MIALKIASMIVTPYAVHSSSKRLHDRTGFAIRNSNCALSSAQLLIRNKQRVVQFQPGRFPPLDLKVY